MGQEAVASACSCAELASVKRRERTLRAGAGAQGLQAAGLPVTCSVRARVCVCEYMYVHAHECYRNTCFMHTGKCVPLQVGHVL